MYQRRLLYSPLGMATLERSVTHRKVGIFIPGILLKAARHPIEVARWESQDMRSPDLRDLRKNKIPIKPGQS